MGKFIFVIGVLGIALTLAYDRLAGKPEVILGPRSHIALAVCGILVILGLIFWKSRSKKD